MEVIYLIIVIVVLGILAVTAAPKFIDISSDANKSVLEALKGNIQSAASLTYAKSAITGVAFQAAGEIDIDNDGIGDIATKNGYPSALGIIDAMQDNFSENWHYAPNG